jgi:hypothetical protein
MVKTPYGEARRLAYFGVVTEQAEKFLPCDITFLVEEMTDARIACGMRIRYRYHTRK